MKGPAAGSRARTHSSEDVLARSRSVSSRRLSPGVAPLQRLMMVLEELGCREALHTAHDAWTAREPGGGSPTVRRRLPPGK